MRLLRYTPLVLVFSFVLLQALQQGYKIIQQAPLLGIADTTKRPPLSASSYFNHRFQPSFEKYLEEQMGFRPALIRTRNQIDYTVFHHSSAPGVVIGKNRQLFIESYVQNARGLVFRGEEEIIRIVRRIGIIQDELHKHNVDFLLIFAPGKASFYDDHVPSCYARRPVTNYSCYLEHLNGSGIHFIDMNAWFRGLQGKTPYPLYPLNGTHWSSYGIALASDSLFRYIEDLRNIDLPDFGWDTVFMSDSMQYTDYDIGELMNLWRPVPNDPMPYPRFQYHQEGKVRPKVVAIGDSYWWGFTYSGTTANVFERDVYWFYLKDIYVNNYRSGSVIDLDLKETLFSQDLVILMVTEATFQLFPYGFTDLFFEKCLPDHPEYKKIRHEQVIEKIRKDPGWLLSVKDKARKYRRPLEDQIRMDAQFMLDQEQQKP